MDQQILQILKDAATVIQALMDERSQMQQQMMAAEQQQQQQQQPQQDQPEKQASWDLRTGFSQPVHADMDKNASSEEDALSRFMAAQAEILEDMGIYTGTST